MKLIHAVFEDSVFRPTEPVDLPEGSQVRFAPEPIAEPVGSTTHLQSIDELLSQSVDTNDPGLSERHDEHQP